MRYTLRPLREVLDKRNKQRSKDIVADSVKTRHIGDGIRFIKTIKFAADRPAKGIKLDDTGSTDLLYTEDNTTLNIWNQKTQSWDTLEFS